MKTVVIGEPPPEIARLIERRHALGQDRLDEVWEGDYHMNPGPHPYHGFLAQQISEQLGPLARAAGLFMTIEANIGLYKDDFRVPDASIHRSLPSVVWVPTAAMVIEVLCPDDETYEKLPFYAARDVDEVLIIDGASRSVRLLAWSADGYADVPRSALIALDVDELSAAIDWPA